MTYRRKCYERVCHGGWRHSIGRGDPDRRQNGRRRHPTLEQIAVILEGKRQEGGETAKLLRHPELVRDLLMALSAKRVAALVARHAEGSEVNPREPGVPNLFLFKTRPDGGPWAVRFVEVKRPKEPLRPHQAAEIRFLRSLGLKAGVVRLIEHAGPPRGLKVGA